MSDVSGDKVEALAGGPLLQEEVIPSRQQQERLSGKALARTTHRLIAALQQVRFCIPSPWCPAIEAV